MSKAFNKIRDGLLDAIKMARGQKGTTRYINDLKPIDVEHMAETGEIRPLVDSHRENYVPSQKAFVDIATYVMDKAKDTKGKK